MFLFSFVIGSGFPVISFGLAVRIIAVPLSTGMTDEIFTTSHTGQNGTLGLKIVHIFINRWCHIRYQTGEKAGEYRIEKQPGVEDIVKQYMYYMAYKPLLKKNNIDIQHVENYYVMPTDGVDEDCGYAKVDFFSQLIPNVFNIRVKKINAEILFGHYLQGDEFDVSTMPV